MNFLLYNIKLIVFNAQRCVQKRGREEVYGTLFKVFKRQKNCMSHYCKMSHVTNLPMSPDEGSSSSNRSNNEASKKPKRD